MPNDIEAQLIGNLNHQRTACQCIAAKFLVRRAISKAHNATSLASTQPDRALQIQDAIRDITILDKSLDKTIVERSGAPRDLASVHEEHSVQPSAALHEVSYRNVNLMLRLLLHQCIINCHENCQSLHGETTISIFGPDSTSIVKSSMIIANVLDTFLSTIPYITAPLNQPGPSYENNAPKNAGAYFVLWPLHILADSPYTNLAQKIAAHNALIMIGTKAGLNRAFEIARRFRLEGSTGRGAISKVQTHSIETTS